MQVTTILTMKLKLNSFIKVMGTNFVYMIFFYIYLLLEDIQDPESPNDTKKIQIDEVRRIFCTLN